MIRAVLFDFNGTLSNDEPIWFDVYRDLYAAEGRPITRDDYFGRLAGLSDNEGVATWLGRPRPEIVAAGIERYLELAGDGSTVPNSARDAVAAAAALVPVGVVTTARRRVLEHVLAAAGVAPLVAFTIAAEDVSRTKPDPEGYRAALARLDGIAPGEVLVFEDTQPGVAAARAAGMRCVAVLGTTTRERLEEADEVIETLDAAAVRRLLA